MKWFNTLSAIGTSDLQSTYMRGLIQVANKAAVVIPLLIILLFLPLALLSDFNIPILLINAAFYPLTLYFNRIRRHQLAQHYLIILLLFMIASVAYIRGIDSGVLFVAIPLILLLVIFFYGSRTLPFYLGIVLGLLILIFIYDYILPPLAAYTRNAQNVVFFSYLILSLLLTALFINFFIQVTRRYQKELEELNTVKVKLLSIIGHDMQAPLNSLNGVLQLLKAQQLNQDEFHTLSNKLQVHTRQVTNTLQNLLRWSHAQLEGIKLNASYKDVAQVAEEQVLLYAEMAAEKKIRLTNEIPPETYAYFDQDQLRLILRNLIHNAIKYTQSGQVTLKSKSLGDYIRIEVIDTGTGMSAERVARLLSHAPGESLMGTSGERGTGLGLQISKEMVNTMGGTFHILSKERKGSCFAFTLPKNSPPFFKD